MDTSLLKSIATLAIPMILSNITLPLLGLVDTAVIGHLSDSYYLGGVAVGSMLITLLFWGAGFLRMSTTGVVAQAVGRQQYDSVVIAWRNSAILAMLIGLIFIVFSQPIWWLAEHFMSPSQSVGIYAYDYFSIRIWSAPATLLNLATLGCLVGMQNVRPAMWLLIVTNLMNIALDLLFVIELDMGVSGAAFASVIADFIGAGLGVWILSRILSGKGFYLFSTRMPSTKAMVALLQINRDIFLRSLVLQLCFSFMTLQGAKLGDDVLAANAVLLNFLMFISFALDGFAYAIEALGGKAIGSGERSLFERSVRLMFVLAGLLSLVFSLVFAIAGNHIIGILTDIEPVRLVAAEYLPWICVLPILAVWCFILDGVYIGALAGKIMRNAMLFSACIGYLPVWWLLRDMGNHGLWAALCSFMLMRGLTLAWHYRLWHWQWFVVES